MMHKGTIALDTQRLILRRFTMDDLEQIFTNCWGDQEVWKWTNYKPMHCVDDVINIAEMFTDKWLEAYDKPNRYSWAIQLKSSGEVIGRFFGMNPDDQLRQVELAYELGRNWWNQGLMTEAVKTVIDFFFKEACFNRIQSHHAIENSASGKVMKKVECFMKVRCGRLANATKEYLIRLITLFLQLIIFNERNLSNTANTNDKPGLRRLYSGADPVCHYRPIYCSLRR